MSVKIEASSTLTDRYQTTVPEPVRQALRLGKRDRIHYTVKPDGEVVLSRAVPEHGEEDPALGAFLEFMAQDIARHPERLQTLDPAFAERIESLVADIEVDLDAPLADDNPDIDSDR